MHSLHAILVAVTLTAFAPLAHAGTVTLAAAADNTLFEDANGGLSNGQGESFFAGETALEELRRGLIRFDFSAIPAGSTITGVTLTLACTRSISLAEDVSLHRSLASWGEGASNALGEGGRGAAAAAGDATWLHRFFGSTTWTTAGGDFETTPSATTAVAGTGQYAWSSNDMINDVQLWLDAPSENMGWFVIGAEGIIASAKRFGSRENADAALRPSLVVTYVIPSPGVLAAGVLGAVVVASRRRRA
jgi:hypothetical protein